jgi:hypothetical protein
MPKMQAQYVVVAMGNERGKLFENLCTFLRLDRIEGS